ncbi:IEC3 subunit of the ino80 complex, chromatin re-modelling domain-containing protein [Purpureocillium lavendulum]|uniref:IEC3 subunit of the ino80 complex, chromatin re-modelling domain-containing protein n=1 Tax=Purpureocillium lavendulum TaxID=1247861 RepID=A0AB34FD86_9HYPO|nr:IEC3 subunit of the ino80 complex, chromatin re-modelling domain-containing protein [Purpureocillium lavendulum]
MGDSPSKADDGPVERRSAGYKSWKKKYRKMRIVFDQKMQQSEELHKREDKASATVKRLAVENDRLLDMLLEINNSPQIPFEKRIDVALKPPSDARSPVLPLDRRQADNALRKDNASKRLEQLLDDVPHSSYAATRDSHPASVTDLSPPEGEAHPAGFLSADDIDNYIYAVDTAMDPDGKNAALPSLAPKAHPNATPAPHPQIKNPTSVTNWLRKHAPKVFLQDGEHGDGAGAGGDDHHHGDGHHGDGTSGRTGGRKSRGGRGGERGGRGSTRGKRGSAASRLGGADRDHHHARHRGGADREASNDEDGDFGSTPAGRGKRKRDDDPGYRPGGSTSRPAKKKRKSEGGADGTPVGRRSKKDKEAAAAAAAAAASRDD